MKLRSVAIASLTVLLLAAMPRAPFHLGALQIGKPAIGLPASAGRPLVVVAFASWCIGCVEELPQVVADYKRFKGRVDFLGVDYLDNPIAGQALVKKFGIPFPVVSDRQWNNAPAPVHANAADSNLTIHLSGITPGTLSAKIAAMGDKIPAPARSILLDVVNHCKGHTDAQCLAYASAHNVVLSPGTAVAPHATASPHATSAPNAPPNSSSAAPLELPHTFVIDGHGIVRADITGYYSSKNPIAEQLRKLGITAPAIR
ncbi:MAG: TlpA family protein disulfide reductase [Candidatus Eremiobacteraeota bacterium]|nr:TlpA family protein disulfide reductase [Candidatus Eremiobacteraeota bacterium]